MMMLQFEDVLFHVVVDRQASCPSGHLGFGGLFLGHEGRSCGGFCDLYACKSGFLLGFSLVSPLVLVINAREIRHNYGDGKGNDQHSR